MLKDVLFSLGGMLFEYDEEKNRSNIQKHGISFRSAARVFFEEVTRLISARLATNFERGLYYGKY